MVQLLNTTYAFSNLTLRHNEEYFVTVTVSNMAGLSTSVTSNGIKIDRTPPEPIKHMTGRFGQRLQCIV